MNYLTIPIRKADTSKPINEVQTSSDKKFINKFSNTVKMISKNYKGKKEFIDVWEDISKVLLKNDTLVSYNVRIEDILRSFFKIDTDIHKSSNIENISIFKKKNLVEEISNYFEDKDYLLGLGGLSYMEESNLNLIEVSPRTLGLKDYELNTVDFILNHGKFSLERFEEICYKIKTKVINEV